MLLTITNVSANAFSVQEMYSSQIAPGESLSVERSQYDLSTLKSLHALVAEGKATVSVNYDADDLAAQEAGMLFSPTHTIAAQIAAAIAAQVAQGTYSPALAQAGVVITALTLDGVPMQWFRVGKLVTVTGYFDFTSSVGGGTTAVTFDPPPALPIANDLGIGTYVTGPAPMQFGRTSVSTRSDTQKLGVAFTLLAGAASGFVEFSITYLTP